MKLFTCYVYISYLCNARLLLNHLLTCFDSLVISKIALNRSK